MCDSLVSIPFFHACFPLERTIQGRIMRNHEESWRIHCKDATQYRKELTFPLLHQRMIWGLTKLSLRLLIHFYDDFNEICTPRPSTFLERYPYLTNWFLDASVLTRLRGETDTPRMCNTCCVLGTICCILLLCNLCEVKGRGVSVKRFVQSNTSRLILTNRSFIGTSFLHFLLWTIYMRQMQTSSPSWLFVTVLPSLAVWQVYWFGSLYRICLLSLLSHLCVVRLETKSERHKREEKGILWEEREVSTLCSGKRGGEGKRNDDGDALLILVTSCG